MKRFMLGALPLAISLSLIACGSPPARTGQSATATTPSAIEAAAPSTAVALPEAAIAAADEAPVTAMMAELELAGEPYAAVGDPNAPLTVVEFSDYG